MQTKKLLITTLVIAITAAIVLFFKQGGNDTAQFTGKNLWQSPPEISDLQKIRIQTKKEEFSLVKNEQGFWELKNGEKTLPANALRIYDLISEIREKKIESLVAEGKDNYEEYALNPEADAWPGLKLSFFTDAEKPIFELVSGQARFGSGGTQGGGEYVRLGDSEKIYLSSEDLDIKVEPSEWTQLSILNLPGEKIRSVKTENTPSDFQISRTEPGKPFLQKDRELNSADTDALLKEFEKFKAKAYVELSEKEQNSLQKSSLVILELFDGSKIRLQFFDTAAKIESLDPEDKILQISFQDLADSQLKSIEKYFKANSLIFGKSNFERLFKKELKPATQKK